MQMNCLGIALYTNIPPTQ